MRVFEVQFDHFDWSLNSGSNQFRSELGEVQCRADSGPLTMTLTHVAHYLSDPLTHLTCVTHDLRGPWPMSQGQRLWHNWTITYVTHDLRDSWAMWPMTYVTYDPCDPWPTWLITHVTHDQRHTWLMWPMTHMTHDPRDRWPMWSNQIWWSTDAVIHRANKLITQSLLIQWPSSPLNQCLYNPLIYWFRDLLTH